MKEERRPRESKESGPHEVVFKLHKHTAGTHHLFSSLTKEIPPPPRLRPPLPAPPLPPPSPTRALPPLTSVFPAAAVADIRELIFELVWRDAKTDLKVILSVRSSRKSCRQGDCYEFGAGPISTSLNGIVAEDQAFPSPTFREFPSGIQNPSLN
ncbi:hypothetical protein HZH68_008666 [Vespula germanica]|uniref:Uncharacterized protein n=1 Tax=Vespula germanica TaxID=30212 RepID=A0A834N790_VESGE|nr:hypothetical protein HZH68_008666 [Vespula germanica]